MRSLPVDLSTLTLEELRQFRDVDKFLTEKIEGPETFQYLYVCFKFLMAYSGALYAEKKYPAFNHCFDDMQRLFLKNMTLGEGMLPISWMLCDFPIAREGPTVVDTMERFLDEEMPGHGFRPFIEAMRTSRMGLYQEVMSSKTLIKFRELFTGQVRSADHSIEEFGSGELFLTRLVECEGDTFLWGDPKCWPPSHKAQLEDMVDLKLFFFDGETSNDQYREFMTLAGPYWFSVSIDDDSIPILQPDHYLTYYQGT